MNDEEYLDNDNFYFYFKPNDYYSLINRLIRIGLQETFLHI